MPMADDREFQRLSTRLQAGEATACRDVVARYGAKLLCLAAPRLRGILRAKIDAEDVVQSAFRSFFRVQAARPFHISGWNDLWSLLATITLRKCRYHARRFRAAKRDPRREVLLPPERWDQVPAVPTEADADQLVALLHLLLERLPAQTRRVAELALADASPGEIARAVGLTTRSVYRHFGRIKDALAGLDAEEASICSRRPLP